MSVAPGPFPEPPHDLDQRRLPLVTIRDATWYCGHHQDFSPVYVNREAGRFAAPDGERFGTMYMGEEAFGAFIEAFGHGLRSDPLGMYVSEGLLHARCLCSVNLTRPVRLVDLSNGAALKRISGDADSRIADGPHDVSQRWAAAFWAHPEQPDGVLYRARNAPDHRSIALFDRAADAIVAPCTSNVLRDVTRLAAILDHFGCALIP